MLKLNVIGSVGADATTNNVNGKQVINFNVAVNEKWTTSEGEKKERTTWVSCSLWRETKVVDYLKKGTKVYLDGIPSVKTYKDSKGETQANLQLNVSELILLQSKQSENEQSNQQQSNSPDPF